MIAIFAQVELKARDKCKKSWITMQQCVNLLELKYKNKRSWCIVGNGKQ